MGLTNGVYLSCLSFGSRVPPIVTTTLLAGELPSLVFGKMLTREQETWVESYDFEFPRPLRQGEQWALETRLSDRIQHPDGCRYVVEARKGYIMFADGLGDLPVFKELRGRVWGTSAHAGCALTFDHRKGPLVTDVPVTDVTRHVSDQFLVNWGNMCEDLRARRGRQRIGETRLAGPAKTLSGTHPKLPDLHPWPVGWQFNTPDFMHCAVLNGCVHLTGFVREEVEKVDKESVRFQYSLYVVKTCSSVMKG